MYFGIQILPTINASSVLNLHSSGKEDENTSITLKLKIKIFDEATVNCSRDDKPNSSKAGVFVFSTAQQFPPSLPSSIFLICCTLKATEELGRKAPRVSRGKAWLCY